MKIDVNINGINGSEFGIYMADMPSIPPARRKRDIIDVPGSGFLTRLGDFEQTNFRLSFNFKVADITEWHSKALQLKKWLSESNCKLSFSDDENIFYKVSHFDLGEIKRPSPRVGMCEVTVNTIDGLRYLKAGESEKQVSTDFSNRYLWTKPIYKITGEGMCTIEMNGKSVSANVGQNLTIDTEKKLTYRADGTLNNIALIGDYEDLYVKEGINTFSVTPGFVVNMIPNWRMV